MHEEGGLRRARGRRLTGEAVRWLALLVVCAAAGFAVAFVVGHDDDPYQTSDWLFAAVVVAGLTLGALVLWLRRRRRRRV